MSDARESTFLLPGTLQNLSTSISVYTANSEQISQVIDKLTQSRIYEKYKLSIEEWEVANIVHGWLQVCFSHIQKFPHCLTNNLRVQYFHDATLHVSSGKYPTLSSSLYTYVDLLEYIDELKKHQLATRHQGLRNGLDACKMKLEQYFDQSSAESVLYFFATGMSLQFCTLPINKTTLTFSDIVLDPRYNILFFTTNFGAEAFDQKWVREANAEFEETIKDFSPSSPDVDPPPPPSPVKSRLRRFGPANSRILGERAPRLQPFSNDGLQQYEEYKREERIDGGDNPFAWWRKHESKYPILARMARVYLAIPGAILLN